MTIYNPTQLTFSRPQVKDGAAVWRLATETKKLDVNSVYAYLLMCDMFAETCAIANQGKRIVGFVTAFRKPNHPDTLFVWQIGVHPDFQGVGIGTRLIRHLLERKELSDVRYLEATVGAGNTSSRSLFQRLADGYGTRCRIAEHYRKAYFPIESGHEAELIFRIGPLVATKPVQFNPSDKEVVN